MSQIDAVKKVDYEKLMQIGRELLIAIGEDPDRAGIVDTPRRWADWWRELIEYEPGKIDTVFESVSSDQMVVVSGMRVVSVCEHHLMPFWCDISIGYITGEKVLGLSKFARVAHKYSHKPQLQEQLVTQIADELEELLGHNNIAVMATGVHTCMVFRGIKTEGTMTSSIMRGNFKDNPSARQEFLQILQMKSRPF